MIHPTAHSPRRGDPDGVARRPQSGAPTVRLVHGGVQYREYLTEEQLSQRPGPPPRVFQRGGVERGCIAGRMQLEFHHGRLTSHVPIPLIQSRHSGDRPHHSFVI